METSNWKFDGTDDMLDSRDIVERYDELAAIEEMTTEEVNEMAALEKLRRDGEASPDWDYGETLIRESYFEAYIEQLIDDCYPEVSKALSSGEWPMRHLKLDIEDAANEAKFDYIEVEFNGSTYLIRA
jgi:hypothetical protein